MIPVFFGLEGPVLTDAERDLFRATDPAGYILFLRNCVDPEQVKALTDDLKALSGRGEALPILIDQEGGRVARLKPPHWPAFPPAKAFADLWDVSPVSAMDAARMNARAIAAVVRSVGVTVDCLPVLDVPVEGAHDVIGDRAYGFEPTQVASLGKATLDGLREGGVVGVIKHIPGHGRARSDSHLELPVVDDALDALQQDFAPFAKLADAPMAMTAHVVYTAIDAERCATLSPKVIGEVIRGQIGFTGLLMSDDINMKALSGSYAEKSLGCLDAGCDVVLHCSGILSEMQEVAACLPEITPEAKARLDAAMAWSASNAATDEALIADLSAKRDALLALA
ncbi:MAG TPA: beta-N-acetylhexosaminidase [Pedomonas sp.]|uniref:beta-N-acetylhexosaminidase n=1 Tax=Pedomonas sp. TaxID=2976421 RepID=UPI002F3FDD23